MQSDIVIQRVGQKRIRRFRAGNIYMKNVPRSRRPVATDVDNIIDKIIEHQNITFVIFSAKFSISLGAVGNPFKKGDCTKTIK